MGCHHEPSSTAPDDHSLTRIESDGVTYIVDTATGEVLSAEREGFRVDSRSAAEWVMEKLFDMDAEIHALSARESAILDNIRKMRTRVENQRAAFLYRFQPELEQFTPTLLDGKLKSVQTPFGAFGFRSIPAKRVVTDPDAAIAWAKTHAPEAVKVTESLLASKLPGDASPDGVTVEPSSEKFYLKTFPTKEETNGNPQ